MTTAIGLSSTVATPTALGLLSRGGAFIGRNKATSVDASTSNNEVDLFKALGNLWYKLAQPIRYFVSGNLGVLCLYYLERTIRLTVEASTSDPPKHLDSISYFSAYLIHIVAQHALNSVMVYGLESINTWQKYKSTLIGTYEALIFSAFGSTFLNKVFINLGMHRDLAFLATLWIFALLNYVWIGYIVRKTNAKAAAELNSKKKRFVGKREQAKVSSLRGGAFHVAIGLEDFLANILTIPIAATP